jgi:hypothetical protein
LHSWKHDEEAQLYAFELLALDGEDLRGLPLSMRKTNLARLLACGPDGIFVAEFEQGEIGPDGRLVSAVVSRSDAARIFQQLIRGRSPIRAAVARCLAAATPE